MSRRTEQWVWDNSITVGNDRMILAYMGNEANDDGFACFPSIDRLALKCRISTNTVGAVIKRLEAAGEIVVVRPERQGRGHFNKYALVLGRDPAAVLEALQEGSNFLPLLEKGKVATEGEKSRDYPSEKSRSGRDIPIDKPVDIPSSFAADAAKQPKASRLPPRFKVTAEMLSWLKEKGFRVDWRAETEKFCDYWRSQGGPRAVKVDWTAAWRYWIRTAAERSSSGYGRKANGHRSRDEAKMDSLGELWDEYEHEKERQA